MRRRKKIPKEDILVVATKTNATDSAAFQSGTITVVADFKLAIPQPSAER
jgi:hypothetical protein